MKYSPERREAILAKLETPYNRTVRDVAAEEGISATTLYNWRKSPPRTDRGPATTQKSRVTATAHLTP